MLLGAPGRTTRSILTASNKKLLDPSTRDRVRGAANDWRSLANWSITHVWHPAQGVFKKQDGTRMHTCTRKKGPHIKHRETLLWDTLLWGTLVGHSCGALLWDTLVGHSCGTLMRDTWGTLSCDTLVGHSHCSRTLLCDTLVGHSCWTLLRGTLMGHSGGTLLWGSFVRHSGGISWDTCGTLL